MPEPSSRYHGLQPRTVRDRHGRSVAALPVPEPAPERSVGVHLRQQGQRIDHLAYRYLREPTAFWRICALNDAMLPDALAEATEIAIPSKSR